MSNRQIKPVKPATHICPTCQVGKSRCPDCRGLSPLLFLNNKIYYFAKKYSHLRISQEKQIIKIRIIINTLFFIFGITGFLLLIKVFYGLYSLNLPIYQAINIKNEYTLTFWISLLTDTYLVYRISRESKPKHKIDKKPAIQINPKLTQEFKWNNLKQYKKSDISDSFSQTAALTIANSWIFADKLKHKELQNIHLFATILADAEVSLVFSRLGVDYKKLSEKIKRVLNSITDTGKANLSIEIKQTFLNAYLRAYNHRKNKVTSADLLYAMAHEEGIVKEILYDLSITEVEISNVVKWVDLQNSLIKKWREFKYKALTKPKNNMNRAYTAIATPNLDQISHDMTIYAKLGVYPPVVGREHEIQEIFRILEVDKLGAVLVGPHGVGKKTIVERIAELMAAEDVPKILKDKRLVSISVSGLIAGASKAGDLEQRVITVMSEISRSKNIVLFIEDIHHLVGVSTDSGEAMDVAEVIVEQMDQRNFMVLATTTPEYYNQYIEKSSLSKAMQKIIVNEPDQNEAIKILEAKALNIEAKNKIYFSYQSLESTVRLAGRYLHDTYLPEKAIKIIEEAVLMVKQIRGDKAIVTEDDIANIISDHTDIPVSKVAGSEREKLLNLEQKIHERVIGQDEAVNHVASALRRARTELRTGNRPIASFLFLGPTGVGKTEVAKTLAATYFGSVENMIRVDMSEYQAGDALAKLIGYAGVKKGGYLTEAVRKNPFSLILLDEIEKATFDILNVFLQVLDDGRLTDASGKTVDFTNTIIIGTSNAGTEYIQSGIKQGLSLDQIRQDLIDNQLKKHYRPEFLNRFDKIIVFHPLEMSHVAKITALFLDKLGQRLEEKGIKFSPTPEAIEQLSKLGYDPTMGARPLRRVIQDKIEDQLAKLLLEQKVGRRDEIILNQNLTLMVNKAEKI